MSDAKDLRDVIRHLREVAVDVHRLTGRRVSLAVETEDQDLAIRLAVTAGFENVDPNAPEHPLAPGITARWTAWRDSRWDAPETIDPIEDVLAFMMPPYRCPTCGGVMGSTLPGLERFAGSMLPGCQPGRCARRTERP